MERSLWILSSKEKNKIFDWKMPFTLSHPAILLPFRKYFSVTGLVLGCMSPDFEYFIRMKIENEIGHSWAGVFLFCLPVSVLFSFMFHYGVKKSFIENLPLYYKSRFQKFQNFDWSSYFKNNLVKVILSIIIGAFSHIFWDSFTHYDGFMVLSFPIFQERILGLGVYKILQHSSTFLGTLYIFYVIHHLPKSEILGNINPFYWLGISVLAMLIVGIRFIFIPLSTGNLIVSLMMSVFIAMVIIPISLNFINKRRIK